MAGNLPLIAPKFEHDCSSCHYIGHANDMDHYHCSDHQELVQRRSSDMIDYSAMAITTLAEFIPVLPEAQTRRWVVSLQLYALHLFDVKCERKARMILRIAS